MSGKWCPQFCPITCLPFYMWIEHPDAAGGSLPVYGGPFESFTIPEPVLNPGVSQREIEYRRLRYDHNADEWSEFLPVPLRVVPLAELIDE